MPKLSDLAPTPQNRLVARLAVRDYAHEWLMSTCFVLALSAALVPLLVLFGLKYGIINNLLDPIRENPRYREIVPSGSGHFSPAWFEAMAERRDVAFLIPKTRSIAASMKVRVSHGAVGKIIDTELIPSAEGDPVLGTAVAPPVGLQQVVVSANAAAKLGVQPGSLLDGILTRLMNDEQQTVFLPLTVSGIAPSAAFPRDGLFVSLPLLVAVEDYRDGRAIAEFDTDGAPRSDLTRNFAGFRLYARGIDDVIGLQRELLQQQIDVRTKSADIELVNALDRNLSIVFWIIAVIVVGGFCLSFGTSLWANANRKSREYSLLRLIGFSARGIVWFPMVQALLTGALGWLLACLVYFLIQLGLNGLFLDNLGAGQSVCRLHVGHVLVALVLTLIGALLAASAGGLRVVRMELSEGLRGR